MFDWYINLHSTFKTEDNIFFLLSNCDNYQLQVLCFGLSLPLTEHEAIRDCVNIYCDWLTALTTPLESVPKPIIENPNLYSREIIHHLLNLFVPRDGSSKLQKKKKREQYTVVRRKKLLFVDKLTFSWCNCKLVLSEGKN